MCVCEVCVFCVCALVSVPFSLCGGARCVSLRVRSGHVTFRHVPPFLLHLLVSTGYEPKERGKDIIEDSRSIYAVEGASSSGLLGRSSLDDELFLKLEHVAQGNIIKLLSEIESALMVNAGGSAESLTSFVSFLKHRNEKLAFMNSALPSFSAFSSCIWVNRDTCYARGACEVEGNTTAPEYIQRNTWPRQPETEDLFQVR